MRQTKSKHPICLNLFPRWTGDSVHNHLHFKEQLKLMMILTKAQEIKTVSSQCSKARTEGRVRNVRSAGPRRSAL